MRYLQIHNDVNSYQLAIEVDNFRIFLLLLVLLDTDTYRRICLSSVGIILSCFIRLDGLWH